MSNLGDTFLWTCKSVYLKNIHPFDFDKKSDPEYQLILETGKSLINDRGLQDFLFFLMEGKYRIQLWTAYIALEFGRPEKNEKFKYNKNKSVIECCINEIEKYTTRETNIEIKNHAQTWLTKINNAL